ncbi:MAG: hypothetical protein WAK17_27625 [Candidatus Nitrosopolaris sp.]|jgi:hypothetical protein
MVAVVVMKSYDKFDISGFYVQKQPRCRLHKKIKGKEIEPVVTTDDVKTKCISVKIAIKFVNAEEFSVTAVFA